MPAEYYARKTLVHHETPLQQPPAEYLEMYGRQYFECAPMRCKLSVESCADNHRRGLNLPCLDCPAGAKHAATAPSRLYPAASQGENVRSLRSCRSRSCIRCGDRHVSRLMADSFCPKCWNRCLELISGRNSKGHWPKEAAKKLRLVEALIVAEADELGEFLGGKFSSTKVLKWEPISAGATLLTGIAAGRQEVEAMLARILPDAEVVDFTERAIEPPTG